MPQFIQEPGYSGELVSLGGVISKNRGRQIEIKNVTVGPVAVQIMDDNPKRYRAFLQNTSDTPLSLFLGSRATTVGHIIIPVGATFQFDNDFPWCGAVIAVNTSVGDTIIPFIEVSIA
jgi:hypothetical protein